jgi:hypothetical protein
VAFHAGIAFEEAQKALQNNERDITATLIALFA